MSIKKWFVNMIGDKTGIHQFINYIDFTFEDIEETEAILWTHTVSPNIISNLDSYGHLIYDDNGFLSQARFYEDGIEGTIPGFEDVRGILKYNDWPKHDLYNIDFNDSGLHQLGGIVPPDFYLPKLELVAPVLYLGYINHKAEGFSWLPFTLHLVCPIHHNFQGFYLDYSDPNAPISINNQDIEPTDCSYDAFTPDSAIIYDSKAFDFIKTGHQQEGGMAGVPVWIQHPQIPLCPKTNNIMRFVCQFDGGVSAQSHNITPENDYYRRYYEEMNFWGSGILYVFFEPSSKVACYIIQNT